ncbi:hypothetical protein BO82DRAFT_368841 [Aspergillus uvarum CBS 121591]|uniref:Uncharacterized protein n=1 Tax=Aspergillus uvarum CBS 121591 TaxID=1448315 RepID=A0A319C010_9EURO|nr:hypothetical protein BO82DRAFT_368841 [Aspergillus uvarum CBS 121591]PYH77090.1 hypothetical protein BO82DRAFT_368841 [Aspergillus uvarum CBS 121591]
MGPSASRLMAQEEDDAPSPNDEESSGAESDEYQSAPSQSEDAPARLEPQEEQTVPSESEGASFASKINEGNAPGAPSDDSSSIASEDKFTIPPFEEGQESSSRTIDDLNLRIPLCVYGLLRQIFSPEEGYQHTHTTRHSEEIDFQVLHVGHPTTGEFFCLLSGPTPPWAPFWYAYSVWLVMELDIMERVTSPEPPITGMIWREGRFGLYERRRVDGSIVTAPGTFVHDRRHSFDAVEDWFFLVDFLLRFKGEVNYRNIPTIPDEAQS